VPFFCAFSCGFQSARPISLPPFGVLIAMVLNVLPRRQQFEIADAIVAAIAVLVVDVTTCRNGAVMPGPHNAVKVRFTRPLRPTEITLWAVVAIKPLSFIVLGSLADSNRVSHGNSLA
jgi:hypothetical protein